MKAPARRRLLLVSALALGGVLVSETLLGRAGGGGGYRSGGGGSGGSGSSDGGFLIQIFVELFRLCVYRPAIGLPLMALFIVVCYMVYRRGGSVWSKVDADWDGIEKPPPQSRQEQLGALAALARRDAGFDEGAFRRRAAESFLKIQKHWSDGGMSQIRPLVTDGVQERFEILLEINKRCGLRNLMKDVQVRGVQIRAAASDAFFDTIEVKIDAVAVDTYVTADGGKLVHGSGKAEAFAEYWSFIRRPGAKTKAGAKGLAEGNCPSCAAPLKVTDRGECTHCKAVVNSGAYDWVLSEITQLRAAPGTTYVASLAALTAKDPGFNVQYAEDRASVLFWRLRFSEVAGSPKAIEGVAAPAYIAAKRQKWERLEDGGTRFYGDTAVGSVDVVGFAAGAAQADGKDRLSVRIKWSGREVRAKLPAVVKPHFGQVTSFDQEMVLVRAATAKSAGTASFASRSCANCGAAETRTSGVKCAYCGSLLNDGALDWVLLEVKAFGVAGLGAGSAVPPSRGEPTTEHALAAAIALAKVDGKLHSGKGGEYELLAGFAESRGIERDALDQIVQRVRGGEMPAALRFVNGEQKRNFLFFMLKLCMADGEISADEEAFMLRLAQKLAVGGIDLAAEIAKARKALQKSGSSGRLVS